MHKKQFKDYNSFNQTFSLYAMQCSVVLCGVVLEYSVVTDNYSVVQCSGDGVPDSIAG